MRRFVFAAAVCGTLVLAACNDQTSTEPAVPPPSENFGSCGATPFPLAGTNGIAQRITNIYPATPKAQALLRAEALLQAGAIKVFWDTCHPEAARKAAFVFIDWLNRHTPAGKQTQVQDLIVAILRAIGEVGPAAGGDFGVGFFNPNNPNKTLIQTLNGHALVQLDPGSFLVPTEIVINRKAGDPPLTDAEGRRQFPPTYDYNAINSTNTHVLQSGKRAVVAFCLVFLDDVAFPGGYPENLAIGHNPVVGAPGFPFEILDPVDLVEEGLRDDLNCPGQEIGSADGGLQDLANAALRTAGRFLLPQPLWATTMGTLPPPPPIGGRAPSLSPFKPVENTTAQLGIFEGGDPAELILFRFVLLRWGCEIEGPCHYPTVRLLDAAGAPIAGAEVSVNLELPTGVGAEGGFSEGSTTTVTTDEAGLAVFNNLVIFADPLGGGYKLTFSASGASPITTSAFYLDDQST